MVWYKAGSVRTKRCLTVQVQPIAGENLCTGKDFVNQTTYNWQCWYNVNKAGYTALKMAGSEAKL